MRPETPRGLVYRCPVCGAEVAILAFRMGSFEPRCCNVPMVLTQCRLCFYVCPVCGAEVAVVREGAGVFSPHCCNVDMIRRIAA